MNKKDLIDLGVAEDVAEKIVVMHGKGIEGHKAKISTVQAEADALKAQLTEAGKAIEGFKALKPEELQKAADEWKAKAEKAQADAQAQMAALKFDNDFEKAMTAAKVKYTNEVKARLKAEELKDKNGTFISERFVEQIEKIKSESSDLFTDETPTPKIVTGGNPPKTIIQDAVTLAARKAAGLPVGD